MNRRNFEEERKVYPIIILILIIGAIIGAVVGYYTINLNTESVFNRIVLSILIAPGGSIVALCLSWCVSGAIVELQENRKEKRRKNLYG